MELKRGDSLKKQVYESIRLAVIQRELKRNVIYSEQWFADQYKISRTPVREALLQLRNEGLIEVLPNRGVYIRQISLQETRDVFQMRSAIEGFCSEYLAEHSHEEGGIAALDRISVILDRCEEICTYDDEIKFHIEIIAFSENKEFMRQFKRMRLMIDIFYSDLISMEGRSDQVYEEHKRIYDFMKAGDALNARRSSDQHLQICLEKVQKMGLLNSSDELELVDCSRL